MESITVTVVGVPVAKARHRMANGIAYTPKKTANWEAFARMCATATMQGRCSLDAPCELSVLAIFPVPKSWPEWKRDAALAGEIRHTTKPDLDNILKAAKDALNGVVYADDAQVTQTSMRKQYGTSPRVVIEVYPVTDCMPCQIKRRPSQQEQVVLV